jgi:hypothetical protein
MMEHFNIKNRKMTSSQNRFLASKLGEKTIIAKQLYNKPMPIPSTFNLDQALSAYDPL